MRFSGPVVLAALVVASQFLPTLALAEARPAPLPMLGMTALGQLGAAAGCAYLVWRRRRRPDRD